MTVAQEYDVFIKTYDPTDPRLGRQVRHDSRSRAFFIPEADSFADIKSVVHKCHIPMLDQADVGSCTGDTGTEVIASDDLWPAVQNILSTTDAALDQQYAYGLYSDTTRDDPFPGYWAPGDEASQDTGSDGLSTAKTLQKRGLISGYQHGNSLLSTLTGLQERSMMTGTKWLGDMFKPTSDGQLKASGNEEGGHEYTLFAVDAENRRIWIRNHWTLEWGVGYPGYADGGCAWMTWDDYEELVMDDGDSTMLIPHAQPAPAPTPIPAPTPTPVPTDPQQAFEQQSETWLSFRHAGRNKAFAKDLRSYLDFLKR